MLFKLKFSPSFALAALLGITAIWGSTFLVVQDAVNRMPVMDFLAFRFSLAAAVMISLRPKSLCRISRDMLLKGITLGLALGAGYIFQTFGLLYTSASTSGFITGMLVVLTPVLAWVLLRRKTSPVIWFAVALAVAGLALISLREWGLGIGELLTLACALSFALHVVGLGEWSSRYDIYSFTVIQLGTVALASFFASLEGGLTFPPDGGVWSAVIVTAVLATSLAFLVQTWAQSLVSPARAAVVLTMEPVFAGFFGIVIGGDELTLRIGIGAACIIAAMLLAELKPGINKTTNGALTVPPG